MFASFSIILIFKSAPNRNCKFIFRLNWEFMLLSVFAYFVHFNCLWVTKKVPFDGLSLLLTIRRCQCMELYWYWTHIEFTDLFSLIAFDFSLSKTYLFFSVWFCAKPKNKNCSNDSNESHHEIDNTQLVLRRSLNFKKSLQMSHRVCVCAHFYGRHA